MAIVVIGVSMILAVIATRKSSAAANRAAGDENRPIKEQQAYQVGLREYQLSYLTKRHDEHNERIKKLSAQVDMYDAQQKAVQTELKALQRNAGLPKGTSSPASTPAQAGLSCPTGAVVQRNAGLPKGTSFAASTPAQAGLSWPTGAVVHVKGKTDEESFEGVIISHDQRGDDESMVWVKRLTGQQKEQAARQQQQQDGKLVVGMHEEAKECHVTAVLPDTVGEAVVVLQGDCKVTTGIVLNFTNPNERQAVVQLDGGSSSTTLAVSTLCKYQKPD